MATYATLTVPVQDIIGADFNASRASVWIEPNVPFVLADSIRVGGRREQVVNGVATFANLVTTDTADNPASFGYRVTITAPPKGAAARKDIVNLTTADFPFTATAVLTDISEAWDNIVLPVEWRSAFRDEMEALLASTQAVAGADTAGDLIAAVDADAGSDFRVQQDTRLVASFARRSAIDVRANPYGATGDGTTDDSVAIRSAITDAAAAGVPVYLAEGTYNVAREGALSWVFNLPTNTKIYGPGTLKLANGTAPGIGMFRIASGVTNVSIEGITLDLNRANTSVEVQPQRHGLQVFGTNVRVTNVRITGARGDGILLNTGAKDIRITNCRMDDLERNGVTFYGNSAGVVVNEDVLVANCHIEAGVQPIDSEPTNGYVKNIRIVGNYLSAGHGSSGDNLGITVSGVVDDGTADISEDYTIIGNTIVGGISVINSRRVRIIGNYVDARSLVAANHNALWNYYRTDDVALIGNTFLGATDKRVITLAKSGTTRPSGYLIQGNLIVSQGTGGYGISATGVGPLSIQGNTIRGANGSNGIYLQATADMESSLINGNVIEGYAKGIYVATFSTFSFKRLSIIGNSIDNRESSPVANYGIQLAGTAAQFVLTHVSNNIVDPQYLSDEDLSTFVVRTGGTYNQPVFSCNGTPEGAIVARVGSQALRRDGGAGTTLYIKETGTGNTGWVAK